VRLYAKLLFKAIPDEDCVDLFFPPVWVTSLCLGMPLDPSARVSSAIARSRRTINKIMDGMMLEKKGQTPHLLKCGVCP
jgi:hypothetical protein